MKYFSKLTVVLFIAFISINNDFGQTWNFDYRGTQQLIILQPGRYKRKVWGAEGGGASGDLGYNSGSIFNVSVASLSILFPIK